MALQNFKNIINNKAYFISDKDRDIFEKGNLQSFFGFSNKDAIEFIVYDTNDNQLPQGDFGLARYIPMTSENISDYFLIADGTILQAYNFPTEYFIDVERLLQEAGYTNGIFRTQVNLINHRVGSNEKYDKMWISEISPSRTEIRLFPLKRKETEGTEIFERFNIFVKDGEFREDTIASALSIVEDVKPLDISKHLTNKWGKTWVDKLRTEYKISSLDSFLQTVQNTFNKAAVNEFTNRISDPNDLNFGNPKRTLPKLELSKKEVRKICLELYIKSLDFHLSKPVFQESSQIQLDTNPSVDLISQVMQVKKEDNSIEATDKKIGPAEKIERRQRSENDSKLIKLKNKKEFQLELPPTPPPIAAPPAEELPTGTTIYYSYEITRMGIPASYAQSLFTYLDDTGKLQTIQTDQYGVVGTFCMEENSWKGAFGLYRFNKLGPCGKRNLVADDLIKIDYTPREFPNPVETIITPDGLPNINIKESVTISQPPTLPVMGGGVGFRNSEPTTNTDETSIGMGFGNRNRRIGAKPDTQIME